MDSNYDSPTKKAIGHERTGKGVSLLRPIIAVPAALILLLVAAVLIWTGLHPQSAKPPTAALSSSSADNAVVVANADIVAGQVLAAGDIGLRNRDTSHNPMGFLRQASDAQGHMALAAIRAGSPIPQSAVSTGAVLGIAPHVPVGYRAYAIAVNESSIAGGFLQAGDHVDLYVTLPGALFGEPAATGRKADDQSKSTLLLQGVSVLAVGTKLQTNGAADTSVRTVTVALGADALAKIALASRLGTITFAVRNPADQAPAADQLATLSTLLGTNPPVSSPVRRVAARAESGVVIYAGRDRSVVHVP